MTKQEFEEEYIIPFSDYFGLKLPYGIFHGFQSEIVARVYPEYSFYGKLNLHVEGGISCQDGKVDALFVVFINDRFVQCSMCRGILINVVDESVKQWADWKLYIDEFDEFLEPERFPKERQVSEPVDGESTLDTIKRNFMIDELVEVGENLYEVLLIKAVDLKATIELIEGNQFRMSFQLLGESAKVGSRSHLLFQMTEGGDVIHLNPYTGEPE